MNPSRKRAAPRLDDRRPPLARLESLVAETGVARSRRILGIIRRQLDLEPNPGPWIAAVRELCARGTITENGVFYFTEIFLECVTASAAGNDAELLRIYGEMEAIERAHGLDDDEYWSLDEAPADWRALSDQWDRRANAINVATLRELGHSDLADALASDREEFGARAMEGHHDVFGLEDGDT